MRKALAEGTIALAPRVDGWVEAREIDGALVEALVLGADGEPIGVWDAEGLSRWMGVKRPPRPTRLLDRLAAVFGR